MEKLIKKLKEELQTLENELEAKAEVSSKEDFQDDQFDAFLKDFLKVTELNSPMEEYEIKLIEEVLPPAYISEELLTFLKNFLRN
jgi:hypothetical protein